MDWAKIANKNKDKRTSKNKKRRKIETKIIENPYYIKF